MIIIALIVWIVVAAALSANIIYVHWPDFRHKYSARMNWPLFSLEMIASLLWPVFIPGMFMIYFMAKHE